MFFFTLFSLSLIFTLVAASIPPHVSFAPFLVELRWPVALLSLFLCLSLSLYSKFVDMTIY